MSAKGEVVKGKLDCGSYTVAAGCHHMPSAKSACGGCYARLSLAIDAALEHLGSEQFAEAKAVLTATVTQRRAEAKR